MSLFATATAHVTLAEKLHQIPMEFWVRIGLGVVALIAVVLVLRKIAHVNKLFLGVGVMLFATIVGFNWIYERNEPKWATPTVQWLGGFLPSKGKVEVKGGR